jgi:hypothetical protein
MKEWFEAPVPDQLSPVLTLRILGNGTLLTNSPGQHTSGLSRSKHYQTPHPL